MHKRAEIHKRRNYFLRRRAFDYYFLVENFGLVEKYKEREIQGEYKADESEVLQEFFQSILEKHTYECHWNNKSCKCDIKSVAKDMRMYLKNLAKHKHSFWAPVWRGLSKVEDDGELLRISSHLVSAMWD